LPAVSESLKEGSVLVLVTYDVSTTTPEGEKRLRKVAQVCLNYGQRVQQSVFECSVTPMQYELLKAGLLEVADLQTDSLRFHRVSQPREQFVESFGIQQDVEFSGPLVL